MTSTKTRVERGTLPDIAAGLERQLRDRFVISGGRYSHSRYTAVVVRTAGGLVIKVRPDRAGCGVESSTSLTVEGN